jgi:rhodanese-related sulfurtransferase
MDGIYRRVVLWAMALMLLAGCGAPATPAAVAVAEPVATTVPLDPNISHETVAALHAEGDVTVLDVREPGEYAAGHIPGALLIPLGELPDRLHEVPEEGPVVVVCRSGNRSGQASRFLRQQGFDNVHNMLGGMLAWQRAGYEVEK